MIQIPITLLLITMIIAVIYSTTITMQRQSTEHWGPFEIENFTDDITMKTNKKKAPTKAVLKT
jgi:hypothetical protein